MQRDVVATERVLGQRYRLGRLLGRGGMAEVYEALDERLDRPVAVKVLRADMASRSDVRARFEAEARSAASLSHPNVVAVYDTGEDDGTPYFVMERLPGESLADRIADGPLEEDFVLRVAGDVLGALQAAHAAGLLHRDVKPGNILIGEDGCAKVADFGIAKSAEVAAGDDTTATGLLLGTPAYLAPERLRGAPASVESDLYGLGVVLYEALTGSRPFTGATAVAVAEDVERHVPPPLGVVRPDVSSRVADAVDRAMARTPSARPGSAVELATLLGIRPAGVGTGAAVLTSPGGTDTVAIDSLGVAASAGPLAGPMAAGRRRRIPGLVVGALMLIGFVLAMMVAMALRGDGTGAGSDATTTTTSPPTTVLTTTTSTPPTTAAPVAVRKKHKRGDG